jgi:hypothetical protein
MTEAKKSWEVIIEEDPETGDAILPLPQDMLDEVGWKSGDNLNWIDRNDGSWEIRKVEE